MTVKTKTKLSTEWEYLLYNRGTSLYYLGSVNDVNGLLILPDNCPNVNFSDIDLSDLEQLYGAAFLPAAGYRYGKTVTQVGEYGHYSTSTANMQNGSYGDYEVKFSNSEGLSSSHYGNRQDAFSVRLVREVK